MEVHEFPFIIKRVNQIVDDVRCRATLPLKQDLAQIAGGENSRKVGRDRQRLG
jgi:hypothetical protein